jgi:hypothetical protein
MYNLPQKLLIDLTQNVGGKNGKFIRTFRIIKALENFF